MATKISLHIIFQKHKESLRTIIPIRSQNEIIETLKISHTDRFIFYILPVILATLAIIIIGLPDKKAIDLYTVCLSVFVGLFLNLLVMITSVLRPSTKIWDTQTRIELIEQTFYNISYTIVISLLGLGLILLTTLTLFPNHWQINLVHLWKILPNSISFNDVSTYCFAFLLYYLLSKIILTLLMIIKRVFCLFRTDIQSYKEEMKDKGRQKSDEKKN